MRKSLVVVQFVIAQVLVICMILSVKQIKLFYETDLGFERDHIVTVTMPYRDSVLLQERFRQQLMQHPGIEGVSFGLTSPSSMRNWWWGDVTYSGLMDGKASFRLQWIDHDYLKFYEIPLLSGRSFEKADTSAFALINESAMKSMGFTDPEAVLGESLSYWGNNQVTIIGVVTDYHSQGLKSGVPPHLYLYGSWNFQMAQIKLNPSQATVALSAIEEQWTAIHPDHYFSYEVLSDSLREFYQEESKMANAITAFSGVGITIGCLGLFGLVSFVCARRNREVSIRKVFGASISSIIVLLTREFLILVLIAFALAIPVGWYVMNTVLSDYANHVPIEWTVFLIAGTITLLLAVATVLVRSFNTAWMNPAETLRQE